MGTTKDSKKLQLTAPWVTYSNYIRAMFQNDPEIEIEVADDVDSNKEFKITLKSTNSLKLFAISLILENEVQLGNIKVVIDYDYTSNSVYDASILSVAFDGNPELADIVETDQPGGAPFTFCVFKKNVIQFYADNLGDLNGNISCLLENVAKNIFKNQAGVFFCTDNK